MLSNKLAFACGQIAAIISAIAANATLYMLGIFMSCFGLFGLGLFKVKSVAH